jgi:hypothetical protein
MLGNAQFYHRTIRKMVVVFGTMFNDIEIVRYTQAGVPKEKQKVPLSYGPKERYLTQITSDPNLIKSINSVIPRMSFNLDSLEYDLSRKQVSTLQNFAQNQTGGLNAQFVPVPYNFEFSLSIYVRNTEDGTQILEQILPFFTPDFNVVVNFIPQMDQKYNVPIVLNSVASTVEYEGGMSDGTTRLIIWDLTFTAKGFIWPPVKSPAGLIGDNMQIQQHRVMCHLVKPSSTLILTKQINRFKKSMLIMQTVSISSLLVKRFVIQQTASLVQ